MFDTCSASKGVKFALSEGQLLAREIDRTTFVYRAAGLGLPAAAVAQAAEKFAKPHVDAGEFMRPLHHPPAIQRRLDAVATSIAPNLLGVLLPWRVCI
jgi:hypothetical protein